MRAFHDSRSLAYRSPYGAVVTGTTVSLSIDLADVPADATVRLRTWIDGQGEGLFDTTSAPAPHDAPLGPSATRHTAQLPIPSATLTWYFFVITTPFETLWYGPREGRVGGEGQLYDHEPASYQITSYVPREVAPAWYEGGICYQVFPDRFFRGKDAVSKTDPALPDRRWAAQATKAINRHANGPEHYLVEDWYERPNYRKTPDERVAGWGFYGGTLKGVAEKLDYLQDLGVTVLYLNPIFEASSNHRYDTGDYTLIDPLLGDEDDFRALCEQANARGIHVMIDGVFNHTGRDSLYFNAFGNYPTYGAAQGEGSPYRDWFYFGDEYGASGYKGWWGVDDLPTCNPDNPAWREFVCGENGVVRRWLRAGASGWRLDVVDEYPDDFVAELKAAALAEKPDALILGEVWEDASHKVSYGNLRKYFQGTELDCTMNYPFMEAVIGFLREERTAADLAETIESLRENYPAEAFNRAFNLLGSHDRTRLFTQLGGGPKAEELDDWGRMNTVLNDGQRGLAKGRLWLASLIQMLIPGVPSIYYGDEAGVEGYTDPYNRATFPWGREDQDCGTIVRNVIGLRRSMPHFTRGTFEAFAANDDVFGFWRRDEQTNTSVCVLVNRSASHAADAWVPVEGEQVSEVISGYAVEVEDGKVHARLNPLGSQVLYFHAKERLQQPMEPGLGVLAHITSLPMDAPQMVRTERQRVVDAMEAATAEGEADAELAETMSALEAVLADAGISAVEAIDKATEVLDPNARQPRRHRPGTLGKPAREFVDWLAAAGVKYWQVLPVNPTDGFGSPYAGISAFAGNVSLLEGNPISIIRYLAAFERTPEYQAWVDANEDWLEPYVSFMAIRQVLGNGLTWQQWPKKYRRYDRAVIDADDTLRFYAGAYRRAQYSFEVQWRELRAYANERGVKIVGDMPMYVSADSSDVWAAPDMFQLGTDGNPQVIAGCPPDQFAVDGQLWGNPLYNWDAMRADGYQWWLRRLERAFSLYDYVRLDHFIGFSQYFSIPAGEKATAGSYKPGPGTDLFEAVRAKFGQLPLIAEDLGLITPGVRALSAQCGFPGMDIVQFADGDPLAHYAPRPEKISYTGTHDTQTLLGFVRHRYQGQDAHKVADELVDKVITCDADVAIVPLQDVLGLGDDSRMNVPGVAEGNWSWQADGYDVEKALPRLKKLVAAQKG